VCGGRGGGGRGVLLLGLGGGVRRVAGWEVEHLGWSISRFIWDYK
jgi:hypothetical protein